jgi:hypothetical protein
VFATRGLPLLLLLLLLLPNHHLHPLFTLT